jgi:hypothetical protein
LQLHRIAFFGRQAQHLSAIAALVEADAQGGLQRISS